MIGRRCKHGNVFSRPVLIGRGLGILARARYGRLRVTRLRDLNAVAPLIGVAAMSKVSGGHGGGATPVSIPNTAVKPARADGTWGETPWESRTLPEFSQKKPLPMEGLFRVKRRGHR